MSASFHPSDALLVAYGTGALAEAGSVLLATHLALCPRCRAHVARVETVGGTLLEGLPPSDMDDGALAAVMGRLGAQAARHPRSRFSSDPERLPLPLRGYVSGDLETLAWRRLSAGVEQVLLLQQGMARVRLLRVGAGVAVPEHGHHGTELTMVLRGGFVDLGRRYGRGDVATADSTIVHSPAADRGETCLCVAVTDAPLRLTGLMGRLLNPFLDL